MGPREIQVKWNAGSRWADRVRWQDGMSSGPRCCVWNVAETWGQGGKKMAVQVMWLCFSENLKQVHSPVFYTVNWSDKPKTLASICAIFTNSSLKCFTWVTYIVWSCVDTSSSSQEADTDDQQGTLTYEEFSVFYKMMSMRRDLFLLMMASSDRKDHLTAEEMATFLRNEQKVRGRVGVLPFFDAISDIVTAYWKIGCCILSRGIKPFPAIYVMFLLVIH